MAAEPPQMFQTVSSFAFCGFGGIIIYWRVVIQRAPILNILKGF